MAEEFTTVDNLDFRRARSKRFLRRAWSLVSGQNVELMAWDQVRALLKLRGFIRRGMQAVPVDKIVGSVGRYNDFDNAFLPTQDATSGRWRKINRAFYNEVGLPPVQLYKVGDAYFVLDGNHRVSVAREHGVKFIDAEVQEAMTTVPVTAEDIDADTLTLLGEYAEFLERTHLDRLRPDQNIRFSIGGGYVRLIEHIAVHRYFMGLELKRDIGEDEAVCDWYDKVYLPIVEAIRHEDILRDFPGRTESDLYLWIIDHRHYLRAESHHEVTPEQAASDYAAQFGEKPALQRVGDAVNTVGHAVGAVGDVIGTFVGTLVHPEGKNNPPDETPRTPPAGL